MTSGPDASSGVIITLGAGTEFSPRYPGSKGHSFSPAPSFDIREIGEPAGFSAPDDGLDYSLIETPRFAVGPVANIRWGRSNADMTNAMTGIGGTSNVVELGAFADYWLAPDSLRARAEIRHGVSSNDGLVADFSADFVQPVGRLTISGGPRVSAASAAVMDRSFGISPGEAAANGLVNPFKADAGVRSVGAGVALKLDVTPVTALTVYTRYDRLVGDAAKSPITSRFGSANQTTFGVGLQHDFSFGQ